MTLCGFEWNTPGHTPSRERTRVALPARKECCRACLQRNEIMPEVLLERFPRRLSTRHKRMCLPVRHLLHQGDHRPSLHQDHPPKQNPNPRRNQGDKVGEGRVCRYFVTLCWILRSIQGGIYGEVEPTSISSFERKMSKRRFFLPNVQHGYVSLVILYELHN